MVGQANLQKTVEDLVCNHTYPRFTILVGQPGSGRKLMTKQIASLLKAPRTFIDIAVDEIRDMIAEAYKISLPMVYVIADADRMSPAAKNALLKVTEEPPQNAYFILTLSDLNATLGTIKSRGTVMYMDPYTVDEIGAYLSQKYSPSTDIQSIVQMLCETPGEVDTLVKMNPVDFYAYVVKVVDNVAEVSGSNSFKIAQRIKFKENDEDKYDLRLFWKAFMSVCSDRLKDNPFKYAAGIQCTSKYLQELRITGINKQSTFDMWLLDVRKEWMS